MATATSTSVIRNAPNGISALISGAGVGGLAAALELWRKGCNVKVFEKSRESSTAGKIFIVPSWLCCLDGELLAGDVESLSIGRVIRFFRTRGFPLILLHPKTNLSLQIYP